MNKNLQTLNLTFLKSLIEMLPSSIYSATFYKNEATLVIPTSSIHNVCTFLNLHTNSQFETLIDVCGVDFPERKARFEVIYQLLSVRFNYRLRIKTCVNEVVPVLSIMDIYQNANWYEREVWDLFGIFFSNHSDLRRILTDYGFEGHPLRKDFPLSGFIEVRYEDSQKQVVCEPIELTQEFRSFDFLIPWDKNIR